MKVTDFYYLLKKVMSFSLTMFFWLESQSLDPAHTQEVGITEGRTCNRNHRGPCHELAYHANGLICIYVKPTARWVEVQWAYIVISAW